MDKQVHAAQALGGKLFLQSQHSRFDILCPVAAPFHSHVAGLFAVDQRHPVVPWQVDQHVPNGKGAVWESLLIEVVEVDSIVRPGVDDHQGLVPDGHQVTVPALVVDVAAHHVDPPRRAHDQHLRIGAKSFPGVVKHSSIGAHALLDQCRVGAVHRNQFGPQRIVRRATVVRRPVE